MLLWRFISFNFYLFSLSCAIFWLFTGHEKFMKIILAKVDRVSFKIALNCNGTVQQIILKLADPETESLLVFIFSVDVMDGYSAMAMLILVWPKRETNMPNLNLDCLFLGPLALREELSIKRELWTGRGRAISLTSEALRWCMDLIRKLLNARKDLQKDLIKRKRDSKLIYLFALDEDFFRASQSQIEHFFSLHHQKKNRFPPASERRREKSFRAGISARFNCWTCAFHSGLCQLEKFRENFFFGFIYTENQIKANIRCRFSAFWVPPDGEKIENFRDREFRKIIKWVFFSNNLIFFFGK